MRNIQTEVLRDVLYCALRQVLRNRDYSITTMRKGYDVVYYQIDTAYHTLSLSKEDGLYVVNQTEQDYSGDYINSFGYKLHEDEQKITDLMNCLDYIVIEIFAKE